MDSIAQAIELAGRPHVVVATPGRLVDLMRSNSGEWDLSRVKFLVSYPQNYLDYALLTTWRRFWTRRIDFSHHLLPQNCRICSKRYRKNDRHVSSPPHGHLRWQVWQKRHRNLAKCDPSFIECPKGVCSNLVLRSTRFPNVSVLGSRQSKR